MIQGTQKIRPNHTIFIAAALKLVLNYVILLNSGYLSDEFLHIEAGHHLAAGYMDFPPMIGILAALQNLFHSDSIIVNRFFANVASVLIVILTGKTVLKLGGKQLALVITLLCVLFSPAFGLSQSLFLPVVFEQLFWVLGIYILAVFCSDPKDQYIIYFAIAAALGFMTKYSILLLFAGLFISVVLLQREILVKKSLWKAVLIFLIIISPNIVWQVNNHFPVFRHISELYDAQLDKVSLIGELKTLVLFVNPVSVVFILAGLFIVPFTKPLKQYRLLVFTLFISLILLMIARGKFYYYLPLLLGIIPLGAVYLESLLKDRKWIIVTYLSMLVIAGIYLLPHGMPLLKLDTYISLYNLEKDNSQRITLQFDNYYSDQMWDLILDAVKESYEVLPQQEKKDCLVWGRHYAHAGAINLLGRRYALPKAFSFHSSCIKWVPEFSKDATIIAIGDKGWTRQDYQKYFNEVHEQRSIQNPYALNENWSLHTIYVCRKLKYNSSELREQFKNEVY